ncbi:translation initiation factor 2 [Actinacidiphila epipremni]|uniref:translation initiation factor 2 n=1 Tax=Actinacidiphila epipremni TaxID=2053013 RepID=UPI0019D146AB|nr:translation initiation factor 2 [Actinacidiphila epipremni]
MYRLLDVLPVFEGDARISRRFTLVPGSEFGTDALAAVTTAGGRTVPWQEACERRYDLILTASPKGELQLLCGDRVLLPHGAGYGKAIPAEGTANWASGLDPAYLCPADERLVLHALAHPAQVDQLRAALPGASPRATVVGDPTLDRLLASRPLRDDYRRAMGTGSRQLVVLASTWGPESLLRRRPGLPAELAAQLPVDTHQLALIVHPNERSLLGEFELAERLAPAISAGMMLPAGHEEWASVLVAADVLVTDHGSAALYFAALGDRPVVNAYAGGRELIPGSPIDVLLSAAPRLSRATDLSEAAGYDRHTARRAVRAAFAEQGRSLARLREELYALLGLAPLPDPVRPRLLPRPAPPARVPAAFDVHVRSEPSAVRVQRIPAGLGPAGHHLAVQHGATAEHFVRTAGLLYRRADPPAPGPYQEGWTAGAWTAFALAEYAGCATAAVILPDGACLLRRRGDDTLWALRPAPRLRDGRIVRTDPAALLSAVHAASGDLRKPLKAGTVTCRLGNDSFRATLAPAEPAEAERPV